MLNLKTRTRRLRFWWNLLTAYLSKYKYWITACVSVVLLIIYLTFNLWPKISRSNIVTIGYVGSYTLETIPTDVLKLATQSLISADKSGRPQPSLASHWSLSEDGKTYVVFIKDNLKWHDSTAIDAKDISIAISKVNITALNNKAIEFKLQNPISSFPLALDKPVFKSKSFYGTGDFRIVDINKIDSTVKKISMLPKNKDLPRVEINFYQNEQQAINALKIGEIKSATIANGKMFEKWSNLEIEKTVDTQEVITIFYDNNDPLLSSKELRQALSFSINKDQFEGQSATGPISPSSWVHNENVKKYDYSVAKAKELLSKSEIKDPQIILTVTPGMENLAENIKKDWESIGVKTSLDFKKNVPEKFQALLAINKLNPDPDQYGLWHSTQTQTNITHFKNVKIDKLLEDARISLDEVKRKELYLDFQKFIVEDAPATFLYHPYKYKVTYKNIKHLINKTEKPS